MLASIQKITSLDPIAGADRIELATVEGWQCIVQKGEFNVGDLCIYVEIDSLLPPHPAYEFLRAKCLKTIDGREWFKIKTIRLKGIYSQGLILSIAVLKALGHNGNLLLSEGTDVSDLLGVVKYEKRYAFSSMGEDGTPVNVQAAQIPSFIIKTDQTNVQNIRDLVFHLPPELTFETTIKIDGTSATYFYHAGHFGVCSRKIWLQDKFPCAYWEMAEKYGIEKSLAAYCSEHNHQLAIQAEIYGPSIQGNNEQTPNQMLIVFDVLDLETNKYLSPTEARIIASALNLPYAHVLETHLSLEVFQNSWDRLIEYGSGPSMSPWREREGVVFKSNDLDPTVLSAHDYGKLLDTRVLIGNRISFKVCSLKYLANEES